MDAITRVSFYFPTRALTSFWLLANVVVNNSIQCENADKQVLTALIVIFSLIVALVSFTDTFIASNNQAFPVIIFPVYGPVCFHLPTLEDKDLVYEHYYLKIRDYLHALLSTATFVLIVVFINPISSCLYPNEDDDLTQSSEFTASTVRTVPIVVALVCALLMMCVGPPRQMLGYANVPETCPQLEMKMGDNPIYTNDGSESGSDMPGPAVLGKMPAGRYSKGYASSYKSNWSRSQQSKRSFDPHYSSRSRSPSPMPRDYPSGKMYTHDNGPGQGPPPRDEEEGY